MHRRSLDGRLSCLFASIVPFLSVYFGHAGEDAFVNRNYEHGPEHGNRNIAKRRSLKKFDSGCTSGLIYTKR